MTAQFRIDQNGDEGDAGVARRDLVITLPITLHAMSVSSNYLWEVFSYPEGSVPVLTNSTSQDATLVLDITGGYLVRLTVNDGLPTKDISVMYLGIPLENSNLCIPAFNETYFDNSNQDDFSGYERKVTAFYRWLDTLPSVIADYASSAYKRTCHVAVTDWTEIPAGTLIGEVFTATLDGDINGYALDGITDLLDGDRILIVNSTGDHAGIWVITDVGSGVSPFVLERSVDFNLAAEAFIGSMVYVTHGTTYGGTLWKTVTNSPPTIDAVSWEPATGLRLYGDDFSNLLHTTAVVADNSTLDSGSTGTLVVGTSNAVGSVVTSAVFGTGNTVEVGVSYSLVAGQAHNIGAGCQDNLVVGAGNTITTTTKAIIGGAGNTVAGATGAIISGQGLTITGGSENSIIVGSSISTLLGGCNFVALFGTGHTLTDSSNFNILSGASHTLGASSAYNAVFGLSNNFTNVQGSNNLIAGESHGGTVPAITGMTHNLIVGTSHNINAGGFQYNMVGGASHSVSMGGITHNLLSGKSHSLSGTTTYSAIIGDSHSVGGTTAYSMIVGRSQATAAVVSYTASFGYGHQFNGSAAYAAIFGKQHTISGGGFNHSFTFGQSNIIGGANDLSFIGGYSNTLAASSLKNFIFGSSNTPAATFWPVHDSTVVGSGNQTSGTRNTIIGDSNTLEHSTDTGNNTVLGSNNTLTGNSAKNHIAGYYNNIKNGALNCAILGQHHLLKEY